MRYVLKVKSDWDQVDLRGKYVSTSSWFTDKLESAMIFTEKGVDRCAWIYICEKLPVKITLVEEL